MVVITAYDMDCSITIIRANVIIRPYDRIVLLITISRVSYCDCYYSNQMTRFYACMNTSVFNSLQTQTSTSVVSRRVSRY